MLLLLSRDQLREFRKNLSDVLTSAHTDKILMKWLRAGNFNLRKCEYLFRENLACRALYDIDSFADHGRIPEVCEKYGFVSPFGFAKDGTPLLYVAMGRGDLYGFVASISSYEICWYCSTCFETDLKRARMEGKKLGKELNEVTYVVDMECFTLTRSARTCVVETAFDLFRLMQDLYPEVWKNLLVVNAAFYFYQAFNILKPIFRHTLLQNVYVVSKGKISFVDLWIKIFNVCVKERQRKRDTDV
ncbi:SEC14-like protein 3 [Trichonephila clavipes]|nr:SEC14-like protein 3 [Trichonephila clavipes]